MTIPAGKPKGRSSTRSAARLAAVQALYQMDMAEIGTAAALADMHRRDGAVSDDAEAGVTVDEAMLKDLVEGWSFDRLELVLRAILRAGTYELIARPDVPLRVAINEWVDLAHAFYAGKEPGFVNGVLDRIGRDARPDEAR